MQKARAEKDAYYRLFEQYRSMSVRPLDWCIHRTIKAGSRKQE